MTSGLDGEIAALAAIAARAAESKDGQAIEVLDVSSVFVICDAGWKYLSTGAYSDDLDAAAANAEKIIYF